MVRKKIQELITSHLAIVFFFIITVLLLSSCSYKPSNMLLMTSKPMAQTLTSAYLSLETLYESDEGFMVIAIWEYIPDTAGHHLKWSISNSKGDLIYTDYLESVKLRPYMFYCHPIRPGKKLIPDTYTVDYYFDHQLVFSKKITYMAKSIINRNIQGLVILPFKDKSLETNLPVKGKNVALETVANGIYYELRRIVPNTVPHYIANDKINIDLHPDCFNDMACRAMIEETFGETLFITGELELGKYDIEGSTLVVHVYNAATGQVRTFEKRLIGRKTYSDSIRDVLKDIMYKQGLFHYIMTL